MSGVYSGGRLILRFLLSAREASWATLITSKTENVDGVSAGRCTSVKASVNVWHNDLINYGSSDSRRYVVFVWQGRAYFFWTHF